LANYTADGYTAAVDALIRKTNPDLVLFPHTYQTRDFAPKLATRFERALISDVIAARVEANNDGGSPVFVRQFFQGKLNGDIRTTGPGPHFVSLQAGAWRADALESGSAIIEAFTPELNASQIRQTPEAPFRESARAVDLTAAEIIVSVGRGIGDKDKIPVVEDLARALGAELAASRPICDAGWLPMERQVGSSGQTVSPKMYVAVGISGAIQHLVGMKGSKIIVAINKDANAPIFEVADYGIVGDLFEVVPVLAEAIRKAKA
jgi:electron transfer flavoprotein alpha subunit